MVTALGWITSSSKWKFVLVVEKIENPHYSRFCLFLKDEEKTVRNGKAFQKKQLSISRFYRWWNQQMKNKLTCEELDSWANLESATASLHEDVYNIGKQGQVNELSWKPQATETRKARDFAIISKVKWKNVSDRCWGTITRAIN